MEQLLSLMQMPSFAGKTNEDVMQFIFEIEARREIDQWDDKLAVQMTLRSLKDEALRKVLKKGVKERDTIEKVIGILKAEFEPTVSEYDRIKQLDKIRQDQDEELETFIERFRQVLKVCPKLPETWSIGAFNQALSSSDIEEYVQENEPDTLEKAFELALTKNKKKKAKRSTNSLNEMRRQQPSVDELSSLLQRLEIVLAETDRRKADERNHV